MNTTQRKALLDRAYAALGRGEIRHAGPAAERLVQQFPDYAPGWGVFSEVWLRCGEAARALDAAETARRLAPDSAALSAQHAKCLVFDGRYREAGDAARSALSLQPTDHATLDTIGNVFSRLGEHERALEVFQRALERAPDDPAALYNLATSLMFFGRIDEAGQLIERTLALDPDDCLALHSRSVLRRQTETDNHVDELRARLGGNLSWVAASHVHYALGKELDDLRRPMEAFDSYRQGAAIMREHMPDRTPGEFDDLNTVADALADGLLDRIAASGHDSQEPIFIIGLPRTGSTLVERILGGHPGVFAAGELHNFRSEAQRLLGVKSAAQAYRRLMTHSTAFDPALLGQAYIESTRPRTGKTERFVDKMPRNDLWAALIHRSLPGARLILTRRNPMDTGYALFRTRFNTGYSFSYDLEQIGRYLVAHRRLTRALEDRLPRESLLTLDYEALVRSPEAQSRRLLQHCGLEWRQDVLDIHRLDTAAATASAVQVRQPFHTGSIGRWRAVAERLEPLRRVLVEAGIDPEGNDQA
ncbi:MAG: tetratricopeptide repeat protein [Pseudomonadota bacterium]|nr:MAG: tetratricopeptide repeat protein [Pseudomonadota bacterium]